MVVGPLVKTLGCRKLVVGSSCLVCLGYTCSVFVEDIGLMYLTYGFVPGLAYGSYIVCAPVAVQQYFDKRRSFAVGVTMAGISIGIFMWPPLTALLLNSYGWQGTVLILGGLQLHGIVIGLLLRPPPVTAQPLDIDATVEEAELPMTDPTERNSSCNIPHQPEGSPKEDIDSRYSDGVPATSENQTNEDTLKFPYELSVPHEECEEGERVSIHVLPTDSELGHTQNQSTTYSNGTKAEKTSEKISRICRSFIDVQLFKNTRFLLYCIGILLHKMGHFLVFTFLPVRGAYIGADREAAALLLSIVGMCSGTGRVVFGLVADKLGPTRVYWNGVSASLGGILTVLSVLCTGYTSLAVYAALYGTASAVFILLEVSCILDLWGREALARGTGILMAVIGLCNLIGTPLTGALMDLTGDPAMPFLVLGSAQVLGGILTLIATILQRRINTRKSLQN